MLTTASSPHNVAATADRARAALEHRGVTVFARIDHAAGARSAGLELPDEQVLIFGNPQAGTPLMQADPAVGYELPLRLLVWDAGGQTMIGYRRATELRDEFALGDQLAVLERMDQLLAQIVAESTAPA